MSAPNYKAPNHIAPKPFLHMYENQEWINRLRGALGKDSQHQALAVLYKHLHKVSFHKLRKVRTSKVGLKNLSEAEFLEFAEDFAQDTIEKLMHNDMALLEQFEGRGSFLAWTSKILLNIISSELRRPYWTRRNEMSEPKYAQLRASSHQPENSALLAVIYEELEECLAQLPERRRIAFVRCIIERIPAEELTDELQTSANAIHIMNHRTRERLRRCMQQKGFGKDILDLF